MVTSLERALCVDGPCIPMVTAAIESDTKEIHQVVNDAYRRDVFRYPERPRAAYEKIHGYFFSGTHTWYVIKLPKNNVQEIACAVLYSTDEAPETSAEGNIHMLSARTSYWGKKMSHLLLRKVEQRAVHDKKSKIRLIVANTNLGLIKLYEQHGYRLTGEKFELPITSIQPQYQGKNPDGNSKIYCLHMEKDLFIKSHL